MAIPLGNDRLVDSTSVSAQPGPQRPGQVARAGIVDGAAVAGPKRPGTGNAGLDPADLADR